MNACLNNSRGDVASWQLTHAQAAHYHARLSRMYADRSRCSAARAKAEARKAQIAVYGSGALLFLSLVLRVISAVSA